MLSWENESEFSKKYGKQTEGRRTKVRQKAARCDVVVQDMRWFKPCVGASETSVQARRPSKLIVSSKPFNLLSSCSSTSPGAICVILCLRGSGIHQQLYGVDCLTALCTPLYRSYVVGLVCVLL